MILRDPVEKLNRSGINRVRYDDENDRLYTAGRDSILRVYSNFNQTTTTTNTVLINNNNIDKHYQMSMSHHTDWINDMVLCKKSNTSRNFFLNFNSLS